MSDSDLISSLCNEIVCLRPWTIQDAAWYVHVRDEAIFRWTTEAQNLTVAQTKQAIQAANKNPNHHCFAIVDRRTHCLMGNIALVAGRPARHTTEIMYWLAPEGRGRGLATQAVKLLSKWALATLNIEQILLKTHRDNVASQRVAERAGYVRRQAGTTDDTYLWFEQHKTGGSKSNCDMI